MKKFFPQLEGFFPELLAACRGKKIAVAGHMRPDGDCAASQFALADILSGAGAAEVVCVNQTPFRASTKTSHAAANFSTPKRSTTGRSRS